MTDAQRPTNAPRVIDVDAHIAEGPTMWEQMQGTLYERRPVMVFVPTNTLYGTRNAFWLIDGNIFPKPRGRGGFNLVTPSYTEHEKARTDIEIACRELTDPAARMSDMDRLHVDVQVVYPTLFLTYITDDSELEVALYGAYNRFLGEACEQTNGRIRFVAALPLRSIEDSVRQLRDARAHGAVGVFFRGIEGSRTLDDPYFFPIYEEAASLDIPICVHTGAGCPDLTQIFTIERNTGFPHVRLPALIGFRDLVGNDIPRQFPRLRFGFIEAGSAWVPFVLQQMKRFFRDDDSRWAPKLFEDNRLFVAC
jgi:predicted TIM-barrel fold metal-dependent hydrolase